MQVQVALLENVQVIIRLIGTICSLKLLKVKLKRTGSNIDATNVHCTVEVLLGQHKLLNITFRVLTSTFFSPNRQFLSCMAWKLVFPDNSAN